MAASPPPGADRYRSKGWARRNPSQAAQSAHRHWSVQAQAPQAQMVPGHARGSNRNHPGQKPIQPAQQPTRLAQWAMAVAPIPEPMHPLLQLPVAPAVPGRWLASPAQQRLRPLLQLPGPCPLGWQAGRWEASRAWCACVVQARHVHWQGWFGQWPAAAANRRTPPDQSVERGWRDRGARKGSSLAAPTRCWMSTALQCLPGHRCISPGLRLAGRSAKTRALQR